MARNKKAPGHFEKRSGNWRWRVCVAGTYHRFTISTSVRQEADTWARKKYDELVKVSERENDGLPTGKLFSDLLDYFKKHRLPSLATGSQRSYDDSLKPIADFFGQRFPVLPVERIRKAHVIEYLDWRRNKRLDGAAGQLHLRTLDKDRADFIAFSTSRRNLNGAKATPYRRTRTSGMTASMSSSHLSNTKRYCGSAEPQWFASTCCSAAKLAPDA
jgi:hypothetical protein